MKRILCLVVFVLALSAVISAQQVAVITEKANLRGTPNSSGKVVTEVSQGQLFDLIKQVGGWFLVQTPDYVGWLHGSTIKLVGAEQTINAAVEPPAAPAYTPPPAPAYQAPVPTPAPIRDPIYPKPATVYTPSTTATRSGGYIRGPRGGCYYYSASGRKVYVDRSLCN